MALRRYRSASASARSATCSGATSPLPPCSGFWRRCSASSSCAAWRCARACSPRPGSGFRGGLFFATLFMGALGGRLFAAGVDLAWPGLALDPNVYAIIGMSALSASVIGGPLTMSFIALESTGNLWITTVVLVAVIISTQITREWFGYSFATWRLHLLGESIRSAADVGWIRDLTVRRLMRPDVRTVPAHTTVSRFRMVFPLGSTAYVVALTEDKNYAG